MTNTATRVWTDLDQQQDGVSHGYLRVPHSTNESGYGWIPVPISIIKNGLGPSVLLMAGNHGDEYEGQVMLMKFLRKVQVNDVRGRIIILPGVNAPAVAAGKRVSPVDDGNLNRLFPGDPNGTPTQMIAHYIDSVLLPQVQFCFDFHSGGYSSEYTPAAHLVVPEDPLLREQAIGFLKAFAMPTSILIEGLMGADQRLLGSCRRLGVGHMSTELAGAGSFSIKACRLAERGLVRLLSGIGVVRTEETESAPATTFYRRQPARDFVYSPATGVFEPIFDLGDAVVAGDIAGVVHCTDRPWQEPEAVVFKGSGIVLKKRAPARAKIGDCLFALGTPIDAAVPSDS